MAATSMEAAVGGVPSLTNNNKATILHQSAVGLRLSADKLALKSAFYNGASSALLFPVPLTQHRITMRAATKGAYICRDCGYIYNDRKPFDKLSDDFRCPVCAAPKRRFKPYDLPVASNANQLDARKARKSQIKNDESVGDENGPFQVTKKISDFSYRLKLPDSWKIHNAFHVSLLRPYVSDVPEDIQVEVQLEVEELDEIIVPEQVLAYKERKVKGNVARRYLVKFKDYLAMDAKWMEEGELAESPNVLELYLEAFGLQSTLTPCISEP